MTRLFIAKYLSAGSCFQTSALETGFTLPLTVKLTVFGSVRQKTTRLPARPALSKQLIRELVVRWMDASKYLLLYVYVFAQALLLPSLPYNVFTVSLNIIVVITF
jgi:hypothetical protein